MWGISKLPAYQKGSAQIAKERNVQGADFKRHLDGRGAHRGKKWSEELQTDTCFGILGLKILPQAP